MTNYPNQPQNGFNPQAAQQYYAEQQRLLYYRRKRGSEINSLLLTGVMLGAVIIAYLIIQIVIIAWLQRSPYFKYYETSAVFQYSVNILAVHMSSMLIPYSLFALINKKKFEGRPLVPMKKLGVPATAAWVTFGMGACMIANIVVSLIMQLTEAMGYKLTQPETLDIKNTLGCIVLIVSTAVVPAIFEEFAFRCCAMGVLRRYGKAFAVVAVSVVFGLTHGNVIQFIFAFLIGLVLGYVTVQTDSVVPAMWIHGLNNGLSVTQEIATYAMGKDASDKLVVALYVFWVVAAICGTVYLALKRSFKNPEKNAALKIREPYALSFGTKLLCLLPGLFIPFCILLFMTAQYIEKV